MMQSAQDFYGESLGRAKGQLQDTRAQLERLVQQVPQEEAQAEIQEMVDSHYEIESRIDQAAQDQGLEDAVNEAAQQGGGQEGGGEQEPNATEAAAQRAEKLGVDLSQVEGSGSEGRITVKDVTSAANQG
jgi:pyruvate/2-oxoglutarate dehydrogenase complex dihydrolipoamide acyltransferase (E2) component